MANILDKTSIIQNNLINAWHVTQSIDAFTGLAEYNIYLSGSLSLTGSLSNGSATNAASGLGSHAEGRNVIASGDYSHAEGSGSQAIGDASHAEGNGTIAFKDHQTAVGQFNKNNNSTDVFVVGVGTNNGNRKDGLGVNSSGTYVSNSLYLPDLANTAQTSVITFDSTTKQLYYAASESIKVTDALNAITSSYALNALNATTSSYANYANDALSSSYSITSSNSLSSSYALTASYALNGGGGGGGGGGTPGGVNHTIQFNSGSTFSGSADYKFIYESKSIQHGSNVTASGFYSYAAGDSVEAAGLGSYAIGKGLIANGDYQTVVGIYNDSTFTNDPFTVGVGPDAGTPDSVRITKSGSIATGYTQRYWVDLRQLPIDGDNGTNSFLYDSPTDGEMFACWNNANGNPGNEGAYLCLYINGAWRYLKFNDFPLP